MMTWLRQRLRQYCMRRKAANELAWYVRRFDPGKGYGKRSLFWAEVWEALADRI